MTVSAEMADLDIQANTKYAYDYPKEVPQAIFRAYDIRGVVGDALTPELVYAIGLAIGTEVRLQNQHNIAVGRDGRLSGPTLSKALIQGLLDAGIDVIDIGLAPTPVLYFAASTLNTTSGVMLTASHNPKNYNGLKTIIHHETLAEDRIQTLYRRIVEEDFLRGQGQYSTLSILDTYIQNITQHIHLAKTMNIVIDCGNGITGIIARQLFEALGCKVTALYEEVDGNFPNHHPDPSEPKNLVSLIETVKTQKADIGFAFDGDGDRCGVITDQGENIWADRQMMLFSMDLLERHPGAEILFDVKCTRYLPQIIKAHGGKPFMWKTGHSLLKNKMREKGALLAGEMSGHVFFKERWYGFDDGLYTACRLLEILSKDTRPSSEIFQALPDSVNTPELKLSVPEKEKFSFMEKLIAHFHVKDAHISTIDGLRVELPYGWGLIRPSNTTPYLILRFEADTQKGLSDIQAIFRQQLLQLDPTLQLPF